MADREEPASAAPPAPEEADAAAGQAPQREQIRVLQQEADAAIAHARQLEAQRDRAEADVRRLKEAFAAASPAELKLFDGECVREDAAERKLDILVEQRASRRSLRRARAQRRDLTATREAMRGALVVHTR